MIFWLPALLPLAITSANLVFWRRLEPTASPPGRLSVLIPARNEGANVDACLAAAVATEAHEIVVCDDASTDDTAVRVLAWSRRDPRIRLLTGSGPPTGWLGKAAACERLRCDATGDWLLFIDADVRLAPDAFARLGSVRPVDLLSVVPTQEVVTFGERLVLPLLHLTYVSWLFLPAIRWSRAPTVVAANGQVMLARADMLNGIGGFACVRHAVVDDMALMRAVRAAGGTIDFRDGDGVATCRMYHSPRDVADGFSKNLYAGIGGNAPALILVISLYFTTLVLPWVAVAWTPLAWVGVGANLLQRLLIAARFRYPIAETLLHPLSILAFFGIALRSAWWTWSGTGRWRGRSVTGSVGVAS